MTKETKEALVEVMVELYHREEFGTIAQKKFKKALSALRKEPIASPSSSINEADAQGLNGESVAVVTKRLQLMAGEWAKLRAQCPELTKFREFDDIRIAIRESVEYLNGL